MPHGELRITVGWVAQATGGRVVAGDPDEVVGRVTSDTRALRPGDFFVALRGSTFDGHGFVDVALAGGARGAMVDGDHALSSSAGAIVQVTDTTRGLQDMAHAIRMASGSRVVAITGSAGKTTTKDTIAAFLGTRLRVAKNQGNLNNHIGLPLSLLQLRERPDVAVMELGMNHAGEIRRLVEVAEPDVRVWLNVGDAHLGFFASADAIADAKAEILDGAGPQTLLVCNADNPRVMRRTRTFSGETVTFGTTHPATVRALDVEDRGIDGICARLVTPAGERDIRTPLLGRGNLDNVLAATAVALELGAGLDDIVETMSRLQPSDRRGVVHRAPAGVTVVDDSYNSSPTALRRALEVLTHDTTAGRRIAVIGEMLELGAHALSLHVDCGRAAAATGLAGLITVGGPSARALAAAAVEAGLPASSVTHVATSDEAAAIAMRLVEPGDLVLVKGSRGVGTDLVVDRLLGRG